MSLITASISDTTPAQASVSPPTPVVTVKAMARGAVFTWSPDTWIQPYEWEYQTQIASEGWLPEIPVQTLFPTVVRTLTAEELTSAGATALIKIQVRSTDGITPTSWVEASANALAISAVAADIPSSTITVAMLATAVTDRMFLTSAKSPGQLAADNTITAGMIGVDAVGASELANDAVDTNAIVNLAVTTGKLADLGVTTNKLADLGVATGKVADLGITAAKIADTTITVGKLASTVTDRMFDSGGRAKLDAVLYNNAGANVPIESLNATSRIGIVAGTDKNIAVNATTIKTDLTLNLVENKTSATIRSEITEANLTTPGGAMLATAWQAFIDDAARNDTIDKDAIETVKASHVQIDAAATGLFDTSGNLTFGAAAGVGIKSGATVIEPADIILAIHTDGTSKNLDFTKPKTGQTLDNIPDGSTYKLISAAKSTVLGYIQSTGAINSSGELTTGTTNFTVAQIEENIDDYYIDFNQSKVSTSAVTTATDIIDVTGDGTTQLVAILPVMVRKGAVQFNIRYLYLSDGVGTLSSDLRDEAGAAFGTPVTDTDAVANTAGIYTALTQTLTIATNIMPGGWGEVRLYQNMLAGVDIKIKAIKVWTTK